MTWIANTLKERIRICVAVNTPNERGSMTMTYIPITELWAAFKPIKWGTALMMQVRGVQTNDFRTHEFQIRYGAVKLIGPAAFAPGEFDAGFYGYAGGLGREFDEAFSADFASRAKFNPITSEYYIKLQREGSWDTYRMFRVVGTLQVDEKRERLNIVAKELEEWGTGHNVD